MDCCTDEKSTGQEPDDATSVPAPAQEDGQAVAGAPAHQLTPELVEALGSGSDREKAVAALRVFCATSMAAGITGEATLFWPGREGTRREQDHEECFDIEDLDGYLADGPTFPIEQAELDATILPRGEDSADEQDEGDGAPPGGETPGLAAWAFASATRMFVGASRKGQPERDVARQARAACEAFREHARFLGPLGIMAAAEDGGWRTRREPAAATGRRGDGDGFERRAGLWAAALLGEPYRPDSWGRNPGASLARLSSLGDGCAEETYIPLRLLAEMLRAATHTRAGDVPVVGAAWLLGAGEDWVLAGNDREAFMSMGGRWEATAPEKPEPLVPGLIYRGALHLFLAPAKTGKSSSLLELATKVASRLAPEMPPATWWGVRIERSREPPTVVFWVGEEHPAEVARRRRALMSAGFDGNRLQAMRGGRPELLAYLKRFDDLRTAPPAPALMIIDTARVFLDGTEDGSDSINAFLDPARLFAERTDCAVIISHHLGKNARPRSLKEVQESVRGSQVWLDRPRVILGMYRSGGITRAGVCDGNFAELAKNISRPFVVHEDTCQLLPAPDQPPHSGASPSGKPAAIMARPAPSDDAARALAAVAAFNRQGVRVTRTGKHGPFERGAPELAGMARVAVRAAVDALVSSGALTVEDGCLYVANLGEQEAAPLAAE
jgi:hypothetical protein